MSLFNIAEPSQLSNPNRHNLVVGIDLGTTHSLVATVQYGQAVVINDEQGRSLLPSVVHYTTNGEVKVGHEAIAAMASDPCNTIGSVKRFMGRRCSDIADLEVMPYDFEDSEGMLRLRTIVGTKNPVEISADILHALRTRAEKALGGGIIGAVVTVPAYFDDAQRQATKDAARLADITVLRLLNEPTAAALAYGLDNGAEGIYAVYDLGGGTFDISILRLSRGVFEVLATGGDSALGGDDFDQQIFCWILESAKLSPLRVKDARSLLSLAREARERLTLHRSAPIKTHLASGEVVDLVLTTEIFSEISKTLVNKTITAVKKTLRDASLSIREVKGVIMVGGATRMPQIQYAVGEFFGMEPLNNLDPDKVVALGAATCANLLAGNPVSSDSWLLLDVTPLSLGIETMGGLVEKIIPRNSTIPIVRAQEFTTFRDGQTALAIHVVQGERELVSDCRSLAHFELRGIPPMVAGAARVRVSYQVDADGLLSVTALETTSNIEASIAVKPSYGLTDDEVTAMLKDSMIHSKEDIERRALKEAQVEAERLIKAVQSALRNDADLVSASELAMIEAAMAKLQTVVLSDDRRDISSAMNDLEAETRDFATRRMDKAMHNVFSGRRIDGFGLDGTQSELERSQNNLSER